MRIRSDPWNSRPGKWESSSLIHWLLGTHPGQDLCWVLRKEDPQGIELTVQQRRDGRRMQKGNIVIRAMTEVGARAEGVQRKDQNEI